MNMPVVMPRTDKPPSLRKVSGHGNVVSKNGLKAGDDGLFAALMMMLSLPGNGQGMRQVDDPESSLSGMGNGGNMKMSQLSQVGSNLSGKLLNGHKHERGDAAGKNDVVPDIADFHIMDVQMPLSSGGETYNGNVSTNSLKEEFRNHVENGTGTNPDIRPEIFSNVFSDQVNSGNEIQIHQTHGYTRNTDIVSQLSEKMIDLYHIGGHTAKIRLEPEELGHLHIDLSVTDGNIKAVVTVEDSSVKSVLESNLDILVRDLQNSGLNIEQFTVNISSSSDYGDNLTGWWAGENGMFNENNSPAHADIEDSLIYDSNYISTNEGIGEISIFA